ncbi:SOS response-associated peptidase family protein [Erythrobacter sp. QSSC1-22B]|uniref:SOS response-associated peptidase family protein n=1 Tax=Erythrobacter sp. QSSC1-22B TaxID=1860125 RepID=UPI0026833F0B
MGLGVFDGDDRACVHVADIHDRMPVVLQHDDWAKWVEGRRKMCGSFAGLIPLP